MIRFSFFPHRKIFLVALILTLVACTTVLVAQNIPPKKEVAPVGTGQEQVDMSLPVAFTGNFRSQLDAIPTRGALVTITQNDAVVFRGTTDGRGQIHTRLNEGPTKFTVQPTVESGFVGMETDVSITGPELAYWFQMTSTKDTYPPHYEGELGYAKMVGYITDEDGTPLSGVLIKVKNSNTQTVSNADGSYMIKLKVNDPGIFETENTFMGMIYGPTVTVTRVSFELDNYEMVSDFMIVEGRIDIGSDIQSIILKRQSPPKRSKSDSSSPPSGGDLVSERASQNYTDCIQRAVVVRYNGTPNKLPFCCGPNSITCTQNLVLPIETYVKRVLPYEWYSNYNIESLKAGAVAIRSYILYRMLYFPYSTNNYHAIAGPCFQAFGPALAITDPAVNATSGQIMVRSDGNVAFTEYSSENNNYGTQCSWCGNTASPGCGNGYVAKCSGSYTQGPTGCISDVVGTGRTRCGHGRGMCQICSQSWASGVYAAPSCGTASNTGQSTGEGMKSYYFILAHYYPNFTLTTVPLCSYPCANVYSLNCTNSQTIYSQSTVGLNNYYNTYNNVGCVTWNMNGPEKIYRITPSSSGSLTANLLSPSNANLRIIILKASTCSVIDPSNSTQVLGYSSSSTGNATVSVTSGQTYFIIVDGKQLAGSSTGQSGTYNLKVVAPCSTPPSYNQQLITTCTATTTGLRITATEVLEDSDFLLSNKLGQVVCAGKAEGNEVHCLAPTTGIYFLTIVDGFGNRCSQKIFVH